MKNALRAVALAVLLTAGGVTTGRALEAVPAGHARWAQMNSAGDGLDGRRAVREGNARPYRMGGMGGRAANRMRRHRAKHHHRHR